MTNEVIEKNIRQAINKAVIPLLHDWDCKEKRREYVDIVANEHGEESTSVQVNVKNYIFSKTEHGYSKIIELQSAGGGSNSYTWETGIWIPGIFDLDPDENIISIKYCILRKKIVDIPGSSQRTIEEGVQRVQYDDFGYDEWYIINENTKIEAMAKSFEKDLTGFVLPRLSMFSNSERVIEFCLEACYDRYEVLGGAILLIKNGDKTGITILDELCERKSPDDEFTQRCVRFREQAE